MVKYRLGIPAPPTSCRVWPCLHINKAMGNWLSSWSGSEEDLSASASEDGHTHTTPRSVWSEPLVELVDLL